MNLKTLWPALAYFALAAAALTALGPEAWVRQSDRSMNPEIIETLRTADYETSVSIMRALGGRGDSYVQDIILWLVSTYRGDRQYKYDYLLEVLLASLFTRGSDPSGLNERFAVNRNALHRLITDMPHLDGAGLKTELIRIIPLSGDGRYGAVLAGEASRLIALLQKRDGRLDAAGNQELLALLICMETLGLREYADQCVAIARLSANRDVVSLARKTAAGLLP
jgi:hypothetical protein